MKIVVALIGILILLFLLRLMLTPGGNKGRVRKSVATARPAGSTSPGKGEGGSFPGVSIKPGPQACEQALALGKKRFLVGQLGQLPLTGCTSSNCTCTFVHHSDRRDSDDDKRAPTALRSELYHASGKPERRKSAGRRKNDLG